MQQSVKLPLVMISSTGSNCGKSTVTLALISALKRYGLKIQSYKSGPDYIDPMFHSKATGRETYHTDAFFSDSNQIKSIVAQTFSDANIGIIEGAMGFYDGIGKTYEASAYTVSEWLKTPVILVINPNGMGCSVSALCKGFQNFRQPNQIQGVILNRIKSSMYSYYKEMIESETNLKVYGYLLENESMKLKSRHLGLVTANEIENLDESLDTLGQIAEKTLDIQGIIQLANSTPPMKYTQISIVKSSAFRLGVAKDRAFCFYYAENLKMLELCGAEIIPFSPIADENLPENLDGLYFGGGYPELYLQELSTNVNFIKSLKQYSTDGIPIFAECGGFMYLQEALFDREGKEYQMAGLLKGKSNLGNKLCRFGYINLISNVDTFFGKKGIKLKAHEFHYSDSTENGNSFTAQKPNGRQWTAIQQNNNIIAGYPHIYFPSAPEIVQNFADFCRLYQKSS